MTGGVTLRGECAEVVRQTRHRKVLQLAERQQRGRRLAPPKVDHWGRRARSRSRGPTTPQLSSTTKTKR
jgi:hypothetical protein